MSDHLFRMRFRCVSPPDSSWISDVSEFEPAALDDTPDTKTVEFNMRKCERTLKRVHDEVERQRSKNYTCSKVVVPKDDYARLFALAKKNTDDGEMTSHESVESFVGVSISVVERGAIHAVRDHPKRAVSEWVFDDGGGE